MYRPCLHCNKKGVDNFNSEFCPTGCEYGWDKTELKKYEALGDYDRLRALAEADRDGRAVVLPCKVREHLQIKKSLYVVEGFLCNKIGIWKVHLVREIPEWVGNQRKHYYMSFRMLEKKRAEAEAALAEEEQK